MLGWNTPISFAVEYFRLTGSWIAIRFQVSFAVRLTITAIGEGGGRRAVWGLTRAVPWRDGGHQEPFYRSLQLGDLQGCQGLALARPGFGIVSRPGVREAARRRSLSQQRPDQGIQLRCSLGFSLLDASFGSAWNLLLQFYGALNFFPKFKWQWVMPIVPWEKNRRN